MPDTIRVLVVDSDPERRARTVESLQGHHRIQLMSAGSVEQAGQTLEDEEIDAVVSEKQLSDGDCRDVFMAAAEANAETVRILFTEATEREEETVRDGETDHFYLVLDRNDEYPYETLADYIVTGYDNNSYAPYLVPGEEKQRIEAIRRYLLSPDPALDLLTGEAADEFGVDKASVRIIDRDRQEYLSCHGFEMDELEREKSICTYTIMDDDLLVIKDVQDDPRFEDIEEFKELDIDWYAGAVIQTGDGHNIGTFCLEDSENQDFTSEDKEKLRDYADRAAAIIELQRSLQDKDFPEPADG